jgi:hypothetical protein
MEETELKKLMDDLADIEIQLDLVVAEQETLKKSRIPLNVQLELESIEEEFKPKLDAVKGNIKVRKEQLQTLLKEYGKPVKSKSYSWSYEETVEWNKDALDGYALTHPEILWMRKEGKPTTRLTPRKAKV